MKKAAKEQLKIQPKQRLQKQRRRGEGGGELQSGLRSYRGGVREEVILDDLKLSVVRRTVDAPILHQPRLRKARFRNNTRGGRTATAGAADKRDCGAGRGKRFANEPRAAGRLNFECFKI